MKKRSRRGSGLIEFAMGFSVLAVLFVGMVQLAYSMIVLGQLSSAVRTGARYAATVEFDEPAHSFVDKIRNVVAYGTPKPAADAEAVAPGLRPEHVTVTWTRDAAGVPDSITVALKGYRAPGLSGERELTGRPRMTAPRTGPWTPPTGRYSAFRSTR